MHFSLYALIPLVFVAGIVLITQFAIKPKLIKNAEEAIAEQKKKAVTPEEIKAAADAKPEDAASVRKATAAVMITSGLGLPIVLAGFAVAYSVYKEDKKDKLR